jgi:hypothetical protein
MRNAQKNLSWNLKRGVYLGDLEIDGILFMVDLPTLFIVKNN